MDIILVLVEKMMAKLQFSAIAMVKFLSTKSLI